MSGAADRVVTIDIGGTHARFAIAELSAQGSISLSDPLTFKTADHDGFESAWAAFRTSVKQPLPQAASMAIAGQADREIIRFTNNPWIIERNLLERKLGLARLTIVNDFEAIAHGVAHAPQGALEHLAGPETPLPAKGRLTVIGPGTGLGVAHLHRGAGGTYHVSPTEGGHIGFAPLDPFEDALLARLRERHGRVSVERVVSGPAIIDIHQTLAGFEGSALSDCGAVELWTDGLSAHDSLAAAAIERFCRMFGSVAGDMALAHGSFGVVIAGGLGFRLRQVLPRSGFAARFCAKGRFASLMETIPVKLITHPEPGLLGAAAAHRQMQGDHS